MFFPSLPWNDVRNSTPKCRADGGPGNDPCSETSPVLRSNANVHGTWSIEGVTPPKSSMNAIGAPVSPAAGRAASRAPRWP